MSYEVRLIQPADFEGVYTLYEKMGWEGTKKEWMDQIKYGEGQSSVLTCVERVVGAALALPFESKVRIAGVIVDASHRGKQLGEKIANFLLSQFEKEVFFELDATPSGKILYKKFGFIEVDSVFTLTGELDKCLPTSAPNLCTEAELDQIEAIDCSEFGASRRVFIDKAFDEEKNAILVTKKDNKITGFILCSDLSETAMRLGPWISTESANAEGLLHSAMQYCLGLGKKNVSINVLKSHPSAIKILNSLGFQIKEETSRMHSGGFPLPNKEAYYALWSLELG